MFERTKIDLSLEKRILAGMIVSKKFMNRIYPIVNTAYFESTPIAKIAGWAVMFFSAYQDVPGQHIKDLVAAQAVKKKIDEEDTLIMGKIIDDLLSLYSIGDFNDEYLTDQAVEFFKKRELEITANNIQYFLKKDEVGKAEREIDDFRKVSRPMMEENGFVYSEEAINNTFMSMKDKDDYFFRMPKDLGRFMGDLNRGWLVSIAAPFKFGKCVYEKERVLLSDGSYRTIKEIVSKKLTNVVTYNEQTGKFEEGLITNHYDNGLKKVYQVTTRTGREVCVTLNHPFLTDKGWVNLSELKKGDVIAVPRNLPFFGEKSISDHKLKVLAYIIADGGLTGGQITFTKTEEIVKQDFINSLAFFGDKGIVRKYDTKSVGVKGQNLSNWFKKIKFPRVKSIHKKIPNFIFKLKKEKLALFLQTLFTCDGSIYRRDNTFHICYSSGSKILLYQINHLLFRFGICSKIRYKNAKCNGKEFDSWILEIFDKENVLKFLKEINFRPGRKKEMADKAVSIVNEIPDGRSLIDLFYNTESIWDNYVNHGGTGRLRDTIKFAKTKNGGISRYQINNMHKKTNNEYFKILSESDILWDKIESIKCIGKKQTYDLTVKDHHNFLAGNIIVHNTFLLADMAAVAALSGLRVVFFSLEMSMNEMRTRIYKRMTGASEEYGSVMFPCFDCKKNKDNSCQKDERVNQMKCPGTFSPASKYRPCSICKDTFEDKDDFELGFWNEIIDVPNFDYPTVQHKIGLLKKEGKANIWLKSKPRFSASIEDLENDLDNLEYVHGFIPDVIVIDYADILQADNKDVSGVQKEDEVWMCLARMASKKKALVLTATQLNKDSLTAKQITTAHTAKWIGKLGHVDAMFALNQTPEEKAMGMVRVSILEHRHKHFIQTQNCYVLQKFSVGCFHLDSYF
jgi:intein/homing endonuclease